MGKRVRGAALRAKKRADAAVVEMVETQAKGVESSRVTSKADDELFVLDNEADPSVVVVAEPKQKKQKKNDNKNNKGLSELDQLKIAKLKASKTPKELRELAKASKNRITNLRKSKRVLGNAKAKFDLWGVEPTTTNNNNNKSAVKPGIGSSLAGTAPSHSFTKQRPALKQRDSTISVEVAHAGQSYHPDKESHQDIIGEALAVELKRKEKQDYVDTPLSKGLSEETKALMLGDSDDEQDSDDEAADSGDITIVKRKEKITKAQRNKQKRHRMLQKELEEKKKQKKMLNSVSELKRYQKELKRKEAANKEKKQTVAKLKQDAKRPLGKAVYQQVMHRDPIAAPSLPVALSAELKSSLRKVKPKGSLIEERFESFRDRKMTEKKHVGDHKRVIQGKKRYKPRNKVPAEKNTTPEWLLS